MLQAYFLSKPIIKFVNLVDQKDENDRIFFIKDHCQLDEAIAFVKGLENCVTLADFAGKANGILHPDERVQIYALKALRYLLTSHITDNSGIITEITKLRERVKSNQINFDSIFLTDQQRAAITSFNNLQKIFDVVTPFSGDIKRFMESLSNCAGIDDKIVTCAKNLTGNFNELEPLTSGSDDDFNTVPEYQYVKDILDGKLSWHISKDGITLVPTDEHSDVTAVTSQQLTLAVNKFKVTTTQNQDNNEKQRNVKDFIQKFECADILSEKIVERQQLFPLQSTEFDDDTGLNPMQIRNKLNTITQELESIKETITECYKGDKAAITIPQLCLINSVNSDPIMKENTKKECINSVIRSSFPQVEVGFVRNQLEHKRFNDLRELLDLLPEEIPNRQSGNTAREDVFDNQDVYLRFETNLRSPSKSITLYEPSSLSDMISLFSLVIHFFNNENNFFPRQCQFLICEPTTTKLQIESFFTMIEETIRQKKLRGIIPFIVVNPHEMMPDVLELFINSFLPYKSKATNTARILIIYDKSKMTSQNLEKATNSFSKASPTGFKDDVIGRFLRDTLAGTADRVKAKSYCIFHEIPRIGKSQLVYEHIDVNQTVDGKEPLYFRLLIDNEITRDTLCKFLAEADAIGRERENAGRRICIHFNIDGQIDHHFTLYLYQLLTFGCINDGTNLPFAYNNNMVFYFEIGAKPGAQVRDFFPIADYMEIIPISTDIRDRFTYNEYVVGKDRRVHKVEMSRRFLASAAALIQMVNYGATLIGDEYYFVDLPKDTMEMVRKVKPLNAKNVACRERKDENGNVLYKEQPNVNTLSQIDKNTDTYTYQEYKKYWSDLVAFFERHTDHTFTILSETFHSIIAEAFDQMVEEYRRKGKNSLANLSSELTIGQIIDIAKVIDHFKGPILSYQTYSQEYELQQKFTIMFGQLLISTAVNNVGFPYQKPSSAADFTGDEDTKRLSQIIKFQSHIHKLLAITDPGKESAQQAFAILPHSEVTTQNLYDIYGLKINEEMKSITDQFIDKDKLKRLANFQNQLFSVMNDILKLSTYRPHLYNAVYTVKTWDDLTQEEKRKVSGIWTREVIEKLQSNARFNDIPLLKRALNENQDPNAPVQVTAFRTFMNQVRDLLVEAKKDQLSTNSTEKNEKPILVDVGFTDKNGVVLFRGDDKPSMAAEELVQSLRAYLSDRKSKIESFAFTEHSIIHFLNMIYRIYAGIPIILMGETGSGKTFSICCLAELIGSNVRTAMKCIDGGTTRQELIDFIRPNIDSIKNDREIHRAKEICALIQADNKPIVLKDLIKWVLSRKQVDTKADLDSDPDTAELINRLTSPESIEGAIDSYVNKVFVEDPLKKKYHISSQTTQEALKKHIQHHFDVSIEDIESSAPSLLFFLDEVNTASCQWYIKDLIVDRYFENEPLPPYVRFISAVNPSREMPEHATKSLKALDTPEGVSNDALAKLVYKVHHMPESFIPFLMPADPARKYFSYKDLDQLKKEGKVDRNVKELTDEEKLLFWDTLSDFDLSVSTIVKSQFNKKAKPYDVPDSKKDSYKLVKDTPNCYEKRYGYDFPFAQSERFSMEFNETFTNRNFTADKTEKFIDIIANLNIIGCRVIHKVIYNDKSFSSLREPTRCMQLLSYFFKFGIFEDYNENGGAQYQIERFRKAFILAFSLTYVLRLASYSVDGNDKNDRAKLIGSIIKAWSAHNVPGFEAPSSVSEWSDIIKEEFIAYSKLLVDENEGISLNDALIENIWATYHTIINNIPLWIIGMPGTSKSLAVNVVLNKMYLHRIKSKKITELPQSVTYQTYMCSQYSTSAALKNQISRIVYNHRVKMSQHNIIVQILEEIGHADLSPYLPLKCLHQIIDNGQQLTTADGKKTINVKIDIIGLSNYKMDSAKLNRGILLVRGDLGNEQTEKTARDIFEFAVKQIDKNVEETLLSQFIGEEINKAAKQYTAKFNEFDANLKKFFGLRDFYGFLHCLSKLFCDNNVGEETLGLLKVIFRNFSGINDEAKRESVARALFNVFQEQKRYADETIHSQDIINESLTMKPFSPTFPLMRHILVRTTDLSALTILLDNPEIMDKAELFFAQKMTNISDDQWISNELQKLAAALREGRTVLFVGKHPCFDSLYDIFNLRYQAIPGKNIALIANAGDSYSVTISPEFHSIIIVEDEVYDSLPPPFLNRFEKQRLTFEDTYQNKNVIKNLAKLYKKIGVQGHLSEQYVASVEYTAEQLLLNDPSKINSLLLLGICPSVVFDFFVRHNETDALEQWLSESALFSSVESLISLYQSRSWSGIMYSLTRVWNSENVKVHGIQAIALVPSLDEDARIEFPRLKNVTLCVINLDKEIIEDEVRRTIGSELDGVPDKGSVLVLFTTKKATHTFAYFSHLQWLVTEIRRDERLSGKVLHTLIVVDMNGKVKDNLFIQSARWPVIYMDNLHSPALMGNYKLRDLLHGDNLKVNHMIAEAFTMYGVDNPSEEVVDSINESLTLKDSDGVAPWVAKLYLSLSQVPRSIADTVRTELRKKVSTYVSFLVSMSNDQTVSDDFCGYLTDTIVEKNLTSFANSTHAIVTPTREQFDDKELGTVFSIMWNVVLSGAVEKLDSGEEEEEEKNEEEGEDIEKELYKQSSHFFNKLYGFLNSLATGGDDDEEEDKNEEDESDSMLLQKISDNLNTEHLDDIVRAYVFAIAPETINIEKMSLDRIVKNITGIMSELLDFDDDVTMILFPLKLPPYIKLFRMYTNLARFVPDSVIDYDFDRKYLARIIGVNTLVAKLMKRVVDSFYLMRAEDLLTFSATEFSTMISTLQYLKNLKVVSIESTDDDPSLLDSNLFSNDVTKEDEEIITRAYNLYTLVLSGFRRNRNIDQRASAGTIYELFNDSSAVGVNKLIDFCMRISGRETLSSDIVQLIIKSIAI